MGRTPYFRRRYRGLDILKACRGTVTGRDLILEEKNVARGDPEGQRVSGTRPLPVVPQPPAAPKKCLPFDVSKVSIHKSGVRKRARDENGGLLLFLDSGRRRKEGANKLEREREKGRRGSEKFKSFLRESKSRNYL